MTEELTNGLQDNIQRLLPQHRVKVELAQILLLRRRVPIAMGQCAHALEPSRHHRGETLLTSQLRNEEDVLGRVDLFVSKEKGK